LKLYEKVHLIPHGEHTYSPSWRSTC